MALVLGLLGDQVGFLPELGGMIFQNILPVRGREQTQQSVSSEVALLMHNETVFTSYRAAVVALLCIRADHQGVAGTTISSSRVILSRLTKQEIQVLREDRWATTVDQSFLLGAEIEGDVLIGPISILEGTDLRPRFRCDFAETRPRDPSDQEAKQVLQRLWEVVVSSAIEVRLRPGDLLLVDNHEAYHGRTVFTPRYDGLDRWLLRSFVVKDLSASIVDRPGDGRIIDRDYTVGPDVLRTGKMPA
jgi:L-asparagine oxygenase